MRIRKNIRLEGKHTLPFLTDVFIPESEIKSRAVFIHGFKGFKDWGHWDLIASRFSKAGILFIKFNFSHNGTTVNSPMDFNDLESFGENNFMKELDDLDSVLNWIHSDSFYTECQISKELVINQKITLIGHSRGGGIAILKSAEDERVDQLITWASVSDFGAKWHGEMIEEWKNAGVKYILNGRTGQNMPLYFQLYENYMENLKRLSIPEVNSTLDKPYLIIHGTEDTAVPLLSARELHRGNNNSRIKIIENANHVFGGSHPYTADVLPIHSEEMVSESIHFIEKG